MRALGAIAVIIFYPRTYAFHGHFKHLLGLIDLHADFGQV